MNKKQEVKESVNPYHKIERRFTVPEANRKQFAERVEVLIKEAGGVPEVARILNMSTSGVRKWTNGSSDPTRENLIALAAIGGVNIEWLATGRGPRKLSEEALTGFEADFALVPIYNVLLSAGPGAFPDDEQAIGNLAFTRYWLRTRGLQTAHLAATNAKGNSMEPTIRDGDMLLIDTQQRELGQDDIYAIRRDDLLMVKRLQLQFDQGILIISDNPLYKEQRIPTAELDIIGRVVWIGHTL